MTTAHRHLPWTLRRPGIGKLGPHARDLLASRLAVGFLEIHTENYMRGGAQLRTLDVIRRDWPVSVHAVGLSLGSAGLADAAHLERLSSLVARIDPILVSGHLSFAAAEGDYSNALLPLPYDAASPAVITADVLRVQDRLRRPVLVENPSAHLRFRGDAIDEAELLSELVAAEPAFGEHIENMKGIAHVAPVRRHSTQSGCAARRYESIGELYADNQCRRACPRSRPALSRPRRGGRLGYSRWPARSRHAMPTERDLAHRLGVTVGTVGRAYELAERQGWIRCEVGRGSFVQASDRPLARLLPSVSHGDNPLDLRINGPSPTALDQALAESLRSLVAEPVGRAMLRRYAPGAGLPAHRAAAAAWLRELGVPAEADRVLLTGGAQAGLHLTLAALARPGEAVLVEELAYPGLRDLGEALHLRLEPVAIDADGMRADALAEAVAASGARLVVVVPDLHNPTTALMPAGRREALVEVAVRSDLLLIEDAVYRPLTPATLPALAALAPDRTVHITSLSKGILPGLRVGALAAPACLVTSLTQLIHATRIGESPLLAELFARWSASGLLHEAAVAQRACADERQARARAHLAGLSLRTAPGALHAWLELPVGWTGAEAARRLEARGLLVAPAELFSFARQSPPALRLALGWPRELAELDRALEILAATLTATSARYEIVV